MTERKQGGEGNRQADQRYRKGVRETVESTSDKERAEQARELTDDELQKARKAEDKGRSRAKH